MRIVIRNSTCWCCAWAVGGYFVLPPLFILPFLSSHHPDRRRGPAAPPGQHLESAQAVLDDPLMQGPRRLGQSLMTGSTGSRSALSDRPNRGSVGPDTHPLHSSPRHRTETMLRYSTFQCTKYEKQDARAAEAQGFRVCSTPEERTMKDRPVGSEPGTCAARHTNRRCDCQTADLVNKSCHGVGGQFHSLTGHPAHVPKHRQHSPSPVSRVSTAPRPWVHLKLALLGYLVSLSSGVRHCRGDAPCWGPGAPAGGRPSWDRP